MNHNFKKTFIFGADTAAYQAEGAANTGGKGENLWDSFLHRSESKFNLDEAVDFYHRYHEDLQIGKEFGFQAIRISVAWARIFPDKTRVPNMEGVQYYIDLLKACRKIGIEPYVTLHHFDSPKWVYDEGDFINKKAIGWFTEYAKYCFEKFSPYVNYWFTFNETFVYGSDKFLIGEAPPQHIGRVDELIQQIHNMTVAHARVVNLFKDAKFPGEIGIVHVLQPKYPFDSNNELDVIAADRATSLYSGLMLDGNFLGGYSEKHLNNIKTILAANNATVDILDSELEELKEAKDKTDCLGINYYGPAWFKGGDCETKITHNGTGEKGKSIYQIRGIGKSERPDFVPTNDWDWTIWPQGLTDILLWVKENYENYCHIYITENGLGYKETLPSNKKICDDYRIDFTADHLKAVHMAIENGVQVDGYFAWSWMDVPSWTNGFNKRYGLIFVDYDSTGLERYPKLSAYWYRQVIKTHSPDINMKKIKDEYLND